MDRGFSRVRPLEGGLDAWEEAGYGVDLETDRFPILPTGSFPPVE